MKVLYLINYAGKAGTEKYVENLVEHLHPDKAQCGLCYNIHGPLAEKMDARGIPTHRLEMRSPLDLKAARALAQLCKAEGYDVIHAQYPRENYIAILAKHYGCKAKVVFTSHLNIRQGLHWRLLNRLFTPNNHRIITLYNRGTRLAQENGYAADRIQVIFNGIDASAAPAKSRRVLEEFSIREDELVITTLSRFSPEKGMLFLCDAIGHLKQHTHIPFRVLMVGDGEELDAIRERIHRLQLEDTILLPGFRSDTGALLAASDLYVNTSENEAMSFAILEALAAGLPVVATDVGGNPDLIHTGGDSGLLAPYGDAAGFSQAILTLLEDPALRRQYSENAKRKTTHEFDLNQLLDEVCTVYKT